MYSLFVLAQTKIDDSYFGSKLKEIRSDFDQKINDVNIKCSTLYETLNSKVGMLENKFTSMLENLTMDHKAIKDTVEKIEACQTAQEKELTKFSKENSEIKNLLKEGFGDMIKGICDINKNTNDKIEDLNKKLDSHIKGCADKQKIIKVSA